MSAVQRLFRCLLPRRWAEDMEAESRTWMVRCACGFERSVWEMGGIRWKAAGRPRRFLTCPHCHRASWHTIYRKTEQGSPPPSSAESMSSN